MWEHISENLTERSIEISSNGLTQRFFECDEKFQILEKIPDLRLILYEIEEKLLFEIARTFFSYTQIISETQAFRA